MLRDLIKDTGEQKSPYRLILYGQEGIGKSCTSSQAEKAVFIPTEDGLSQIKCKSFPIASSLKEVYDDITALGTEEHDFKTLVIDSIDWLEPVIFEKICNDFGVDSILKADGGFNKGYIRAADEWRRLTRALDWLRKEKGMNIILISHSKVGSIIDPNNGEYSKYTLRIDTRAVDHLVEWADAVLFACKTLRIEQAGKKNIATGIGSEGGARIVMAEPSPSCTAKNRFGMPAEIPLDWKTIESYLNK